ncbi:thiamine pyrophosphate-dependent dehydrogenase E1 component subunit alpha [Spiroplasma endosymbiont of Othius punctulatus]|uniref:thiamine pyrophosphate-dependent dehydrogenase E1 component subunit alpha n=1 Tax=Spiroplasma endosymbiont of Othius punctulatus TaxID=3066289 RepID=UPI0030D11C8C
MSYKYLNQFNPFKNESVKVMDKDGNIINKSLMPEVSDEELLEAYKMMNKSRMLDVYQNKMQRQGRLLSFLTSTGQEACEVAYINALDKKTDHYAPGYRNSAAWLTMGQEIRNIMLYWSGNEAGGRAPDGVNLLPPNIVIGTQFSLATGLAFAKKYFGENGIAVTSTGDGGMSEGETYEAMNFAKLHELPIIFISENNKWSISTPTHEQTKSINMAVKAVATAIPSIKVDGNDYLASFGVMQEVVQYVRSGGGPFFVEFDTYRLGAHSSSDSPDSYRPKGEYEEHVPYDPLIRVKAYLIKKGIWDENKQTSLDEEQTQLMAEEFKWVEANKNYGIEDIFKYQFAELEDDHKEQLAEAKEFFAKHPNSIGGHH